MSTLYWGMEKWSGVDVAHDDAVSWPWCRCSSLHWWATVTRPLWWNPEAFCLVFHHWRQDGDIQFISKILEISPADWKLGPWAQLATIKHQYNYTNWSFNMLFSWGFGFFVDVWCILGPIYSNRDLGNAYFIGPVVLLAVQCFFFNEIIWSSK